jgi:prepilin peptidase CpaA
MLLTLVSTAGMHYFEAGSWLGGRICCVKMTYLPPVIQALLTVMVLIAGFVDIRKRRVPNWLTLSGLLIAIALNTFLYETAGLWLSLKGAGLALLIYFPLFALRGVGAGDAKLMAAVGAFAGPANWLGIFVLTGLIGGICAVAMLVATGRTRKTVSNVGVLIRELVYLRPPYLARQELDVRNPHSVGMPHGAIIALAVIAFLSAAAIWAPRV